MATFTFDRPLRLTEQGTKKLLELMDEWEKNPPKPDGIKPYTDAEREESVELLKKYWSKGKKNKTE